MTISFKCPACSADLKAPDEYAGGKARCKSCGMPVHIPKTEQREPASIPASPSSAASGSHPASPPPRTEPAHDAPGGDRGTARRAALGNDRPMADRQIPTTTGARIPKSVIVAIAGLVLLATGLIVGVVLRKPPQEGDEPPTVVAAAPTLNSPDPTSDARAADHVAPDASEDHEPAAPLPPIAKTPTRSAHPGEEHSPPDHPGQSGQPKEVPAVSVPSPATAIAPVEETPTNSGWGAYDKAGFARAVEALFQADAAYAGLPRLERFDIVAKIEDRLYEAVFSGHPKRREHFLLSTIHTTFTSKGGGRLYISYLQTVELEDDSGFDRRWRVFKESSSADGSPPTHEGVSEMYRAAYEQYASAVEDARTALAQHEYTSADLPLMIELTVSRCASKQRLSNHLYGTRFHGPFGLVDHGPNLERLLEDVRRHLASALEASASASTDMFLDRLEAYVDDRTPAGFRELSIFLAEHPNLVRSELPRLEQLRRQAYQAGGWKRYYDRIISAIKGGA